MFIEHSKHFSNFSTPMTTLVVLSNLFMTFHESAFFFKSFPEVVSKQSERLENGTKTERKTILELKTKMKEVYYEKNSS